MKKSKSNALKVVLTSSMTGVLILSSISPVWAAKSIDTRQYDKVWITDSDSEIQKTLSNVDIDRDIDYKKRKIKWTLTYNKDHQDYGGWVYIGIPKHVSIENFNITRKPQGGQEQHTFIRPEDLGKHFDIKEYPSSDFYNDFNLIRSFHNDGSYDNIRVRSDINWWGDKSANPGDGKGRIVKMLVMTTGGQKPAGDNTHKNSDKVTFEFTTSHSEALDDFRNDLDFLPAFIAIGERKRWPVKGLGWPRIAFIGPFGTRGKHDLQMPDPIIVNDKNNISVEDRNKLALSVYSKTLSYYNQIKKKNGGFSKEIDELDAAHRNKKITVNEKGEATVTWDDNTRSFRNEVFKFVLENKAPIVRLNYVENDVTQTIEYGSDITPVEIRAYDNVEDGATDNDKAGNVGGLEVKKGQNFEIEGDLPEGLELKDLSGTLGNKILMGRPTGLTFSNPQDPHETKTLTIKVKASDTLGKSTTRTITINVKGNPQYKPFEVNSKKIDAITEGQKVKGNTKVIEANEEGFTVQTTSQSGLTIDSDGNLSGTPIGIKWGADEEEKNITFEVTVRSKNGTDKKVSVSVVVLRDTDKDGKADKVDDDDDNDGISDEEEKIKHTDPKVHNALNVDPNTNISIKANENVGNDKVLVTSNKPNTKYKITTGTSNNTYGLTVTEDGKLQGKPTISDWTTGVKEKTIQIPLTATSEGTGKDPSNKNETQDVVVNVKVVRDDASTYNPTADQISKNYGEQTTKQNIIDAIQGLPQEVKTKAKFEVEESKLPNGQTPGSHNVKVVVTFEDQSTKEVDVTVNVADKVRTLNPSPPSQTITEHKPIGEIILNADKLASDRVTFEAKYNSNTVNGLSLSDNKITGTLMITDWGSEEESRVVTVTIKVESSDQKTVASKDVTITVERDTDGDGTPDKEDNDDDNDGISDSEDETKKVFTNFEASVFETEVIEKQEIKDVKKVVSVNKSATTINSQETKGLTITQDDKNGNLTGTPSGFVWNDDNHIVQDLEIPITISIPKFGNVEESVVPKIITVKVHRDTDGDGIADKDDEDDDNDGILDKDDDQSKQFDKLVVSVKPTINFIQGQDNNHSQVVKTNKPDAVIEKTSLKGVEITEEGNAIGKALEVTWTDNNHEKEELSIPVKVTRTQESENANVKVTVYRDTDGDGDPDITDKDDDNDGISDEEEKSKNSDPKSSKSLPVKKIVAVSSVEISNSTQTVVDKQKINDIVITTTDNAANVKVEQNSLPNGLSYDSNSKTISGTIDITQWDDLEEKIIEIPITVANSNGTKITKKVELTVQRDTDGDGDPDITDKDDDNDGISDEEEISKNSNPKNSKIRPIGKIQEVGNVTIQNETQIVKENLPIKEIVITTPKESDIEIKNLPKGLNFDKDNKTIKGTLEVDKWQDGETTRDIVITVTVTNKDKTKVTKKIKITIENLNKKPAIEELENLAKRKIEEIENSNQSKEGKDEAKRKVNETLKNAIDKINKAENTEAVNEEKENGKKAINEIEIISDQKGEALTEPEKPEYDINDEDTLKKGLRIQKGDALTEDKKPEYDINDEDTLKKGLPTQKGDALTEDEKPEYDINDEDTLKKGLRIQKGDALTEDEKPEYDINDEDTLKKGLPIQKGNALTEEAKPEYDINDEDTLKKGLPTQKGDALTEDEKPEYDINDED
ncbi:Rib/alpha-like domain-containing protein, partial [Helcococcus bovis]|uniref:Rib/alpha-like domain-containing protein n=1 Tax=Helcococcus bovis TaxID=3153252 RepID=UPI0038B6D217